MNTQPQTTGIKTADEMIGQAQRAGLKVSVDTSGRDDSTVVQVEFRYVVPESAKGSALGQLIEADRVSAVWFKGTHKGARWSMLYATRYELTDSQDLKRPKDVRAQLASMEREAARYARDEVARQADAVEVAMAPSEGLRVVVDEITREEDAAAVEEARAAHREAAAEERVAFTYRGRSMAGVVRSRYTSQGRERVSVMVDGFVHRLDAAEVTVVPEEAEAQPREAVSAPESAWEQSGVGTVPVAAVEPCESTQGVPSALLDDEERAAAEAELLVPRGERLALRVVHGMDDRRSVEERAFVVGVVACQLRAGARSSRSDGALVLRCGGETTVVELAA